MDSYSMYSYACFLYLTLSLQDSSTLQLVLVVHSFSLLYSIPTFLSILLLLLFWCCCCFSILLLMDLEYFLVGSYYKQVCYEHVNVFYCTHVHTSIGNMPRIRIPRPSIRSSLVNTAKQFYQQTLWGVVYECPNCSAFQSALTIIYFPLAIVVDAINIMFRKNIIKKMYSKN